MPLAEFVTPRSLDTKRRKLALVLKRLVKMYGPRAPEKRGPGLDVLVRAMLSQNTNGTNSERGYKMLRRALPTWTKVMLAPVGEVQRQIAICGLSRMRARRLQEMLRKIKVERGALTLDWLEKIGVDDARNYLLGFHGIGPKSAALVLLFALGQPVLPVDNGVLRVCRRLRLVRAKARDAETERQLSPLIGQGGHYATHVLMYQHAKERCRPRNPKCEECRLLEVCGYGLRRAKKGVVEAEPSKLSAAARKRILSRYISAGVRGKRTDDEPREALPLSS